MKVRPWYALSEEERQRAMDEHIRVGAGFASIHNHTTYSFGIDDQEFMTAFECDEPADFMHLMLTLRESEASRYTERDTPIFVGQAMEIRAALDALDGAGQPRRGLTRPRWGWARRVETRRALGEPRSPPTARSGAPSCAGATNCSACLTAAVVGACSGEEPPTIGRPFDATYIGWFRVLSCSPTANAEIELPLFGPAGITSALE